LLTAIATAGDLRRPKPWERRRPGGELSLKNFPGNTPVGRQRSQVCAPAFPAIQAKIKLDLADGWTNADGMKWNATRLLCELDEFVIWREKR
jgi:hypothetical protein